MTDTNPYQPSFHTHEARHLHLSPDAATVPWGTLLGWSIVFVLNLCFPALVGWNVVNGSGRFGLISAVILLYFVSILLFFRFPAIRRQTIYGCLLVGISQLFPVAQVLSGIAAMAIVRSVGLRPMGADDLEGWAGGFCLTVLVGFQLIALGAFLGVIGHAIFFRPKPIDAEE